MISLLLNRSLEIPLFLSRFRKRSGIPVYSRLKSTLFVQKRMRISPHPFSCFFVSEHRSSQLGGKQFTESSGCPQSRRFPAARRIRERHKSSKSAVRRPFSAAFPFPEQRRPHCSFRIADPIVYWNSLRRFRLLRGRVSFAAARARAVRPGTPMILFTLSSAEDKSPQTSLP